MSITAAGENNESKQSDTSCASLPWAAAWQQTIEASLASLLRAAHKAKQKIGNTISIIGADANKGGKQTKVSIATGGSKAKQGIEIVSIIGSSCRTAANNRKHNLSASLPRAAAKKANTRKCHECSCGGLHPRRPANKSIIVSIERPQGSNQLEASSASSRAGPMQANNWMHLSGNNRKHLPPGSKQSEASSASLPGADQSQAKNRKHKASLASFARAAAWQQTIASITSIIATGGTNESTRTDASCASCRGLPHSSKQSDAK